MGPGYGHTAEELVRYKDHRLNQLEELGEEVALPLFSLVPVQYVVDPLVYDLPEVGVHAMCHLPNLLTSCCLADHHSNHAVVIIIKLSSSHPE